MTLSSREEAFYGDAYFLSIYAGTDGKETPKSQRAKKATEHSCPACYRPVLIPGYCMRCVSSGAAARHRQHTPWRHHE